MTQKRLHTKKWRPVTVLTLGYAVLIAAGAAVLLLPAAWKAPGGMGLGRALFMSVSATCVTGLSVVDVGREMTAFGQAALLALIQVGGLGFMLFATLLMLALRHRISLHGRMVIGEAVGAGGPGVAVRAMLRAALIALLIEGAGCVLLCARFVPQYGWGTGLWYGLFHAVSAFCNAGFDLFGGYASLAAYRADGFVLSVISLLVVLGGVGYVVLSDIVRSRGRARALTLHSKLVLLSTALLLAVGFVATLLLEWRGALPPGGRALNAFF